MGFFDFLKGNRSNDDAENLADAKEQNWKNLMEKFRSENWSQMDYYDKWNALQQVENLTAEEEGRIARQVMVEPMKESTYGYFSEIGSPHVLHLNERLLNEHTDGYDALHTLWHEGRHAYQFDSYSGTLLSDNQPDQDTKDLWEANFDNDIYRTKGMDYYCQPIERDANRFAEDKLTQNEAYFKGDPAYEKQKKDMQNEYENASNMSMYGDLELHEQMLSDEIRDEYQQKKEKEKEKTDTLEAQEGKAPEENEAQGFSPGAPPEEGAEAKNEPSEAPVAAPSEGSNEAQGQQEAAQPKENPEEKPEVEAKENPEEQPSVEAEAKPEEQPSVEAEVKPEEKPSVEAEVKPEEKPAETAAPEKSQPAGEENDYYYGMGY